MENPSQPFHEIARRSIQNEIPICIECKEAPPEVLHALTTTLFQSISSRPYSRENRRVFIGEKVSIQHGHLLYENPPQGKESTENWLSRHQLKSDYSLVVNNCGNLYHGLADHFGPIARKIISDTQLGSMGVDQVLFAGNYRLSPLGIHIDEHLIGVVHFIGGPARKNFYLWDKYNKSFHEAWESGLRDINSLKQYAERFEVKPGELFVLPAGRYFHTASTEGFCIDYTLGIPKISTEGIMRRGLATICDQLTSNYIERISACRTGGIDLLLRMNTHPPGTHSTWSKAITDACSMYIARAKSHSWFQFSSTQTAERLRPELRYSLAPCISIEEADSQIWPPAVFAGGNLLAEKLTENERILAQQLKDGASISPKNLGEDGLRLFTQLKRYNCLRSGA